ncbi:MAG TPA: DUF2933 domain-containing protein [Sphingomicrobium sp.]
MALLLRTDHHRHALDFPPFLVLPACPLIHLVMHHGHGGSCSGRPPG